METITIEDSNAPNEEKKVVITETVTEERTNFEGTLNDLKSDIQYLNKQITSLTAEKEAKEALQAKIENQFK